MDKIGIICEYNPFHNGHIYHLNKVKELFPNSLIVLILSGNFTQRGNISIINKWDKTKIALEYGIDLVIELPFMYATQNADIFAEGSIKLLKYLSIDYLVFGSESNDINKLSKLANIQLNSSTYQEKVKEKLKQGINYPTALATSFEQDNISTPNDILGLSYIKEIIKQQTNIKPITIQRTNNYHSPKLDNKIVSATAIRDNINNSKIKNYMPVESYNYIIKNDLNTIYYNIFKYVVLSQKLKIKNYQTVDEGIENRILKYINKANNLDDFIKLIKTKRYTYNKLKRMICHIVCSFTKEEANNKQINYIRVLGFNSKGQDYLNKIKKKLDIPIISSSIKKYEELLHIELRIDSIYNLITNQNNNIYNDKVIRK